MAISGVYIVEHRYEKGTYPHLIMFVFMSKFNIPKGLLLGRASSKKGLGMFFFFFFFLFFFLGGGSKKRIYKIQSQMAGK